MKRMVEKAVVLQICMFYSHLCRQTEGQVLALSSKLPVRVLVRVGISEIQNGPSWLT